MPSANKAARATPKAASRPQPLPMVQKVRVRAETDANVLLRFLAHFASEGFTPCALLMVSTDAADVLIVAEFNRMTPGRAGLIAREFAAAPGILDIEVREASGALVALDD